MRNYAWGSPTAIPELLGAMPDGNPVAELWFGAHLSAPSLLDRGENLATHIAVDPVSAMGQDVQARFGDALPYLLKVIAAERPLSLQVHPHIERARLRFADEEAAGIPRDAPHRSYKDANHKPELVYALTAFEAVCGFRAPRRAAEIFADLDVPLSKTLYEILRDEPTAAGVRTAFEYLLLPSTRPGPGSVTAVVEACAARQDRMSPSRRADATVALLGAAYPGDPGIVASMLLNPVTLQPGEAMFVPAGGVHAYLSGVGIELMASSDNVLRAGLTTKHMDVPELLECVDYVAAPPIRVAPEVLDGATQMFYAPVDDFELSVTTLTGGDAHAVPGRGPRILLCIDGRLDVSSALESVELRRGEAIFVPASDGRIDVAGQGTIVQADVP